MKYMALIYGDEAQGMAMSEEELAKEYDEYMVFSNAVRDRTVASHALHPTETAKTVRVRDGKTLTTDGPFAETKEALGGYYIFECADLDEAIALAAGIPGARTGSVEVRPVVVFDSPA